MKPIIREGKIIELNGRFEDGRPARIAINGWGDMVFATLPASAGEPERKMRYPGKDATPSAGGFGGPNIGYGMTLTWRCQTEWDKPEEERRWKLPVIRLEADTTWEKVEVIVWYFPWGTTEKVRLDEVVYFDEEHAAALMGLWDRGWQQVCADRGCPMTLEEIADLRNESLKITAWTREWDEKRAREREQAQGD